MPLWERKEAEKTYMMNKLKLDSTTLPDGPEMVQPRDLLQRT